MKKLILLTLLAGWISVHISCNDDDVPLPEENFVRYDGKTYTLSPLGSYYIDYGCSNVYCNTDIYISDESGAIQLYFELYSLGSDEFTFGTFRPFDFSTLANHWDDNRITLIEDEDEENVIATKGTVHISEDVDSNAIVIDFSLVMSGRKTLKGNYTGPLTEGITRLEKSKK